MNVSLVDTPLDARAIAANVRARGHGAVVVFEGTVRERSQARVVVGLHYEAYAPLAAAEFEAIAREGAQQFGGAELAIVHRVGDLHVGETSVVVAAGAEHRDAAFAACRYAIDELKRRAPIWKLERFDDGTSAWKHNA